MIGRIPLRRQIIHIEPKAFPHAVMHQDSLGLDVKFDEVGEHGVELLGIAATWQLAVYGFVILLAVTTDAVIQARLRRAVTGE